MKNKNIDHVLWFSKDSVVGDGLITVPSHLKIAGRVNMNIECPGKLVISETGVINGNIKASEIFVFGKVKGDLVANEVVTIHKSGVVNGHIVSKKLVIEEGAVCNLGMAVGVDVDFRKRKTVKEAPATYVNGTTDRQNSKSGRPERQEAPPTEKKNAQPVPENQDTHLKMNISAVSDPEKQDVLLKKKISAESDPEKQSVPQAKKKITQLVSEEQNGSPSEPESDQHDEHTLPYW